MVVFGVVVVGFCVVDVVVEVAVFGCDDDGGKWWPKTYEFLAVVEKDGERGEGGRGGGADVVVVDEDVYCT